ncbi:MAG: MFS transporter [Deltaproteobacteria bacterium]|nr:MFS transporter [Deltaproteobacteria bacterium]
MTAWRLTVEGLIMLARFSIYGFLKNQRYYEPFIILLFLERGFSFTQIGLLVAFREICINVFEVPSGVLADMYGRRRCMMISFTAYIISFALFGFVQIYTHFFAAMFFFAIGEAFRTGTHKAMIFSWLRLQGRLDEKTRIYGYTRSWSKLGSAFSIIIATLFVIFTKNYSSVFYLSIVPYIFGLVNFMYYPVELEGPVRKEVVISDILDHLWTTLRISISVRHLRRLIAESMAFEGVFEAAKDYLQPVIKSTVLVIPLFVYMENTRRSAIVVGMVYFALHLLSAWASRKSHRITQYAGGEEPGASLIWKGVLFVYLLLAVVLYLKWYYVAIAGFVALYVMQNLWRPILISRFDEYATETHGATVLSVESQAKSVSTIFAAPFLGLAVDFVTTHGFGGEFWPVGAVGAAIAFIILATVNLHSRH